MGVSEKRLAVFDALLSGRGLQRIVDVAAGVMGNPVVLIDRGMSPIAVSSELKGDPDWDASRYEADDKDLRAAALSGDAKRMYASDEALIGDYAGAKQRYLAARVRRGGNVLGHALVLERTRPFTEEDAELLPDICRTLGFELSEHKGANHLSERYGTLLVDVVKGRATDRAEVERRLQRAGVDVPAGMVLLLFSPTSERGQISAHHLRGQLTAAFPGCMAVADRDEVVMVADASLVRDGFAERLASRVYLESLAVGVSREFAGLWDAHIAYEQARAAVRLSSNRDAAGTVVRYDEIAAAHLLECAAKTEDVRVFAHPALDALAAADALDGGDRVGDLDAYLKAKRSATGAASMLHVHKNTMYYRLRRVEEAASVDLSDETTCFALELALALR